MRAAITMGSLAAVAALTTLAACASRDTGDASAGEGVTSAAPRSGTVNVAIRPPGVVSMSPFMSLAISCANAPATPDSFPTSASMLTRL